MAVRADVRPQLLGWARERSGLPRKSLEKRFPKLSEWESGETKPTLQDVEAFARATHTPVGFMFLPEPPPESVPIPDFRTMRNVGVKRPSADLLDTVFTSQQHQEWYRAHAESTGDQPLSFAGSLTIEVDTREAAAVLRRALKFDIHERGTNWSQALDLLIDRAEELGVLVMISGIVGSNTRRKLDPEEFRGFALADAIAPLVFLNRSDTRAALLFTLSHELAHIWVGQTALSDARADTAPNNVVERWCNQVAAEFLVPLDALRLQYRGSYTPDELDRLALVFKASTLVVLRRIHDAGYLDRNAFDRRYRAELDRVLAKLKEGASGGGGNFYNTQPRRLSKRFTRAVLISALEGRTLYRDAFRMLGFKKQATFDQLVQRLLV